MRRGAASQAGVALSMGRLPGSPLPLGGNTGDPPRPGPPGAGLDASLRLAFALPLNLPAGAGKGLFHELSHRMGLTCGQNIAIWLGLLKDKPHAFNIIACVPPVASGVEISKIKFPLMTVFDRCDCASNLARHKGFAAGWSFMVEEDAVRGMHSIRFPIIYSDPIGVEFCGRVWRTGMKRRRFVLRFFVNAAIQFGCGGLVE